MTHCLSNFPGKRAFTLIELLAAMSVLTLLLLVVVQMINSAVTVTSDSTRHLDADSQARLAFDRMAADFAQIVKRSDVDYFLKKVTPGDDQMAFYSETTGYYPSGVDGPVPKSNAALVGYRINNRHLERLNKALVWNGVTSSTAGASKLSGNPRAMTFLPQTLASGWNSVFGNAMNPDMALGTDPDFQVIGEAIFRMEICYLVRNATTAVSLSENPYISTPAPPPATPTPTPFNGLRDVAAVVVTLAVLDDTSRLIVQPTDLDAAAAKLLDSSVTLGSNPPTTPANSWQKVVDNRGLVGTSGSGLSMRAASNVHIYERYFSLGNAQ